MTQKQIPKTYNMYLHIPL